jgi:hypothetical protein
MYFKAGETVERRRQRDDGRCGDDGDFGDGGRETSIWK